LAVVDPSEYQLEFFRERGFKRKLGRRCKEYFWTLNDDFDEPQDAPCVEYWFDKIKVPVEWSVGEAREAFLRFFEERGHKRIPPRPVVARWREDLYLTIASIVVFQPHVTSGLVPPPANPLVISQPSIRLEDIDNVGLTIGRHLTGFEMAAHHAFNYPDKWVYWKEETVRLAFEFFTEKMGIPEDMIVFKESWWEGGGNAGPSFEVVVGGLEVATLVFMKYRVVDGRYEEIPLKIVDTGYGVERLSWFTRKTPTAFHSIYGPLLGEFRRLLGVGEPPESVLWAAFREAGRLDPEDRESLESYFRRVAERAGLGVEEARSLLLREARLYSVLDHTRTLAWMLADGVVPSNSGEGYLARLVARRTLRQLAALGAEGVSLVDLVERQINFWGRDFPQLVENRDYILDAAQLEEEKFREAIRKGVKAVERILARKRQLTLQDLVRLYDSHGVPPEIVAEVAARRGVKVEIPHNFYSLVAAMHKSPGKIKGYGFEKANLPEEIVRWAESLKPTRRVFHEDPYARRLKARVAGARGRYIVFDSTLFYPTGGGQIHDTGRIVVRGETYRVVDVQKVGDVIVHVLDRDVAAEPGDEVYMELDWERRYAIMRHHTVTHVLIAAARRVLGKHAWQAGAEKTPEKGRLDITHHRPLTPEQVRRLEEEVNRVILERRRVWEEMVDKHVAEEKYGFVIYQGGVPMERKLRLVFVEDWDVEACFGTHVRNTGEIGGFKIISHGKLQDGVVRLEYVAGTRVADYARQLEERLEGVARALGAPKGAEHVKAESVAARLREVESGLSRYRRLWAEAAVAAAEKVDGFRVLVAEFPEKDRRAAQEALKIMTEKAPDLIAVLIVDAGKARLAEIALGGEAAKRVDAAVIARRLAEALGGKGGGRGSYASLRLPEDVDVGRVASEVRRVLSDVLRQP